MEIIQSNKSRRDKLYRSLDTYSKSFQRRGITILPQAHSGNIGCITISVNGKQGIAQKNIIIFYNETEDIWTAASDGIEYKLLGLSDISVVIKNRLAKLTSVITKI